MVSRPHLSTTYLTIISLVIAPVFTAAACVPNTTDTTGLQDLLTQGAANYTLQLCQNQIYSLTDTLNYTAENQVGQTIQKPVIKLKGFF
jgi:hypothetical protein